MDGQTIYVVCAEGEETLAEQLAEPLRKAGYRVTHNGTVAVGESVVGEAARALASDSPIVLCATARAAGSEWAHRIVNAGHADGRVRVFVVQMEEGVYVKDLALKAKVAKYYYDKSGAIRELLNALKKNFPPTLDAPRPSREDPTVAGGQFLDQLTESMTFDIEALQRFRSELREEVATRYPAALSPWEFLDRTGLRVDDRLTRTGVLLFAKNPTVTLPAAIVQCAQYYGTGLADSRHTVTYEDTVPGQIVAARQFVADRVRRGEAPSADRAQSTVVHDYPMIAVREIIANALVHRDYASTDECIHIRLFPDRLEVSSPGTWRGRDLLTSTEYELASLTGQSRKRNFRLAHILSWIRLVEGEGSGIPSALRDCQATQSPPPVVVQEQGFVTVTLRRRTQGPAQLPADVNIFTGRAAELAELDRLLSGATDQNVTGGETATAVVISAVSGTAGVGKTALALRWAHRVRGKFPDGQLYVNLRGYDPGQPMSAGDALAGFLRALGLASHDIPPEVDERAAVYRSLLDGRRMLVVLDNAATVEQISPLLPGARSCLVMVTSRDSLAGLVVRHGARRINLDLLPPDDAVGLLRVLIGQRVEAELEAAATLAEQCVRLPLALRVAAELAAIRPDTSLAALVAELADEQRRLDLLDAGGDPSTTVRSVFSWSYQHLPADAAQAFRLLGLHPGPDLDSFATAALTDTTVGQAQQLLDLLTRAHLIGLTGPGRYSMHDLLRTYAAHLTAVEDSEDRQRTVLTRLFDHYLATAAAAMDTLYPAEQHRRPRIHPAVTPSPPLTDPAAAGTWLDTERANLTATCGHTASQGWPSHTTRLANTLYRYLDTGGHHPDSLAIHTHALHAARHTGDPVAEAHALTNLGVVYRRQGRYQLAVDHLQQALTLFRQVSDRAGEARALTNLGAVYWQEGHHQQAAEHHQQALTLFRQVSDRAGEARALTNLGAVYQRQGHHQLAADNLQQALTLCRETGYRAGEVETLNSIGEIHHATRQVRDAHIQHTAALTLAIQIGDRYEQARALNGLAYTHYAIGDADQARNHWREGLTLYTDLGVPEADDLRARLAELEQPANGD